MSFHIVAPRGILVGPMVVLTWAVVAGWVGLALGAALGLTQPWGAMLALVGLVGAAATATVAFSMHVAYDETGIVLPGLGHTPWSDVHAVDLADGVIAVPTVGVREGRVVRDIPLDGLAWFGGPNGFARTLAERVAALAGVGEVGVRGNGSRQGRRGVR